MTEYTVKIGFWLRAYDGLAIEADSDAEAIEKAKAAAKLAMASTAHPDHIDTDERLEGIIAFIDRISPGGRQAFLEDVAFDDDRIHSTEPDAAEPGPSGSRRVVFQYLVPVHVEVEDGLVCRVTVIDETPVSDPTAIDGNASYLSEAVAAADDGQAWPSWQFGY